MAIKYNYKPRYKNRSLGRVLELAKENSRNLGFLVLSIALIFSFSMFSNRITGYATYTSDLESSLNETVQQLNTESRLRAVCNSNLDSTKAGLTLCNDKLSSSQSYLVSCENDKDDLKSYSDQLNSLFSSCDLERAEWKTRYANETENYRIVVRNSVKAICCSFGDSQSGTIRSWGIENNQIVCSGNFSVNCTAGNTNY